MSRLDELIRELCPDGVEHKPLLSVAEVLYGYPCNASMFNTNGEGMPLARIRDVLLGKSDTYTNEIVPDKYILSYGDLLVGMDGNFHVSNWKTEGGILCQRVCKVFSRDNRVLLDGYLSHLLKPIIKQIEDNKKGGTVKHLLDKDIKAITIPVPPIEVQREIVRILDKFTELSAELIMKLSEELASRKKQYAEYSRMLFDQSESVRKTTLGEIVDIQMCKRIKKDQTTSTGEVPFFQNGTLGGIAKHYISKDLWSEFSQKYKYPQKGEVMLSTVGTVGKAIQFDGSPAYFQDSNIVWLHRKTDELTDDYLYWFCLSMPWKLSERATLKHLHNYMIVDTEIAIPSLERQIFVIEKFQQLTKCFGDIVYLLEKEILNRQKQYEYYRDKLLTFKPLA